ncbi:MAG: single-stranded-DNA-specific exonuclease RecJ, partial [Candidatus Omnitrophica bacterium]|nr:single-stranded-DNA-specific exonuclease RecJ [Candidatus Omnitrophota bacterium]
ARLHRAKENHEKVLIFGDYDVDGVTSSALMHHTLKRFGLQVTNHIPHRMQDGYGMNDRIGEIAKVRGATLVVAVDCGITAFEEVAQLNTLGIDVIILDHHEPSAEGLPPALAVIDPKRSDCRYPFKHLASVGMVAKFTQALLGEMIAEDWGLVALGTIADVVPLRGENRIFVKIGLPQIGLTTRKGLGALLDVAKIKGKEIKPHFIGFILGPRINAMGRMDTAQRALDLFLSEDHQEAYELAKAMDSLNTQRQKLQRSIIEEAKEIIEREVNFKDHKVIVLSKAGWHKGVLGIVASHVTEKYYRPTIVISVEDGIGTASARSIDGFHLHEALTHCGEILENFGGHKLAAGLRIREENIDQFRQQINEFAERILEAHHLTPRLDIDSDVPLHRINLEFAKLINHLEPYGEGNSIPVFCSRQLTLKSQPAVLGKDTLKFWVTDGKITVQVVGFGMGKYREFLSLGQKVDLAYEVGIDDWNKDPIVQLKLRDIKI